MYDVCCKVPLLIKTGQFSGGHIVREEVVNLLDLFGTILDMAGDEGWKRDDSESRSLVPLLTEQKKPELDNRTFSIIGSEPQTNLTMLRRVHMKLIRQQLPNGNPIYELYDLTDQVQEVRNVFDDPQYSESRHMLVQELDHWANEQANRYP